MATGETIRDMLDGLKPGWGAKFAGAFEEIGIEDIVDLSFLTDDMKKELEGELKGVGAKTMHIHRILGAVAELSAAPSKLKEKLDGAKKADEELAQVLTLPAVAEAKAWRAKSAKRYAAFLSHHKQACAMEARFIKGELERLLSTTIFLDSDNLRDLRTLLDDVRDSDVLVLLQSSDVLNRPWTTRAEVEREAERSRPSTHLPS